MDEKTIAAFLGILGGGVGTEIIRRLFKPSDRADQKADDEEQRFRTEMRSDIEKLQNRLDEEIKRRENLEREYNKLFVNHAVLESKYDLLLISHNELKEKYAKEKGEINAIQNGGS